MVSLCLKKTQGLLMCYSCLEMDVLPLGSREENYETQEENNSGVSAEFSNQQDPQGPSYQMADAGEDSELLSDLGVMQRSLGQLF